MTPRDEIFDQFLIEARELVERATTGLAALCRTPGDQAALAGLFRTFHTLKGSVGLFDLPALEAMLHAAENLLERARAADRLDGPDEARLVRTLDTVEGWLEALESGDGSADRLGLATADLTAQLAGAADRNFGAAPDTDAQALGARPQVAIRYTPHADAYFRGDDPLAIMQGVPGLVRLDITADPGVGDHYDPFRCTLRLAGVSSAPPSDVRAALRLVADQIELEVFESPPERAAAGPLALRSLRVEAQRLDDVAGLVDELVVAKNALLFEATRLIAASPDGAAARQAANAQAAMERVVSELHAAVTGLRLVPLRQLFSRFPRQVRETAEALGKDAEFLVGGEQVSLDKSIVEGLFEPLLHLLRNAIDHGIETPSARRAAGKRERALITVTAQARGDSITIDVADDGRGIDVQAVREAAVLRGLIDTEAAADLTEEAAAALVFTPGFSTAREAGQLSGRGVGMDAVRAAVNQLGGRMSLENRPGRGLTVRLTLPSQVILTKVLVVTSAGERFGVPLESVSETHRVTPDEVTLVRSGRAFVRRRDVIPILRLSDLLGAEHQAEGATFPVLTVGSDGSRIGIQVDEVGERFEAPLRPMRGLMAAFPGVLGTVLEGDGRVLVVLDLPELAA